MAFISDFVIREADRRAPGQVIFDKVLFMNRIARIFNNISSKWPIGRVPPEPDYIMIDEHNQYVRFVEGEAVVGEVEGEDMDVEEPSSMPLLVELDEEPETRHSPVELDIKLDRYDILYSHNIEIIICFRNKES